MVFLQPDAIPFKYIVFHIFRVTTLTGLASTTCLGQYVGCPTCLLLGSDRSSNVSVRRQQASQGSVASLAISEMCGLKTSFGLQKPGVSTDFKCAPTITLRDGTTD